MSAFTRVLPLLGLMVLASGVSLAARADDAAARRLLELTHARELAVPVYMQVHQMFARRFEESKQAGTSEVVLERYVARANAMLDRAIGWERLEPELVALYQAEFSDAELKAMVAFYESEVGAKMLARLPDLNRRSAQMAQQSLEKTAPEINQLLADMAQEISGKKTP